LCDVDKQGGGAMSGTALRTTVVQSGADSRFRSDLPAGTVSHLVFPPILFADRVSWYFVMYWRSILSVSVGAALLASVLVGLLAEFEKRGLLVLVLVGLVLVATLVVLSYGNVSCCCQ
jgi:hypothetical protein